MLPKRILLAEDDLDDQEFFSKVINSRNDVALIAMTENGEEIFECLLQIKAPEKPPDLIILDQNMPKRNGLQTLKMLKEHQLYRNIPVFIYSTHADTAVRQSSLDLGAASVFSKPYTADDYHSMINNMLELLNCNV